jgi:hypothetical protein
VQQRHTGTIGAGNRPDSELRDVGEGVGQRQRPVASCDNPDNALRRSSRSAWASGVTASSNSFSSNP